MSRASEPTPTGELPAFDRRTNLRLRTLIDDMLQRVRELTRSGAVSEEERARAEAELEAVMARVRRTAARQHTK